MTISTLPYNDPARNGTPLDRRVHLKDGLDWDLIRANYSANASDEEREWQEGFLDGTRKSKKKSPQAVNSAIERQDKGRRLSGEDKEQILRFHAVGMSMNWIAGEIGFGRNTVREFLKREGKLTAEEESGETYGVEEVPGLDEEDEE